jgi:acyl carrier protein
MKSISMPRLLELLQEALLLDSPVKVSDARTTLTDWDSVGHLSIISALEAELGADAVSAEIQQAASVQQIVDSLRAAGHMEE